MKNISVILFLALALSLVAGTFAVTVSYYTDSACKNSVASPFNGVSQPIDVSVNQCFLAFNNGSTVYAKATLCNSTFASFDNFNDAACATVKTGSFVYATNMCLNRSQASMPNNAASEMVTCASSPAKPPSMTGISAASIAIAVSTSVAAAFGALAFVLI